MLRAVTFYLTLFSTCIERRRGDALLVDCFLGDVQNIWYFNVEHTLHKSLNKAVEPSGVHWSRAN
jgi:hypothetical protein